MIILILILIFYMGTVYVITDDDSKPLLDRLRSFFCFDHSNVAQEAQHSILHEELQLAWIPAWRQCLAGTLIALLNIVYSSEQSEAEALEGSGCVSTLLAR